MKCDDCLNLLESYADGEVTDREAEQLSTHLATCVNCSSQFELLSAEGEMYARYDRELEISPSLWNGIAARLAADEAHAARAPKLNFSQWFAGLFAMPSLGCAPQVAALVVIELVSGIACWRTRPSSQTYVAAGVVKYQPAPVARQESAGGPKVSAPEVSQSRDSKEAAPTFVATSGTPKRPSRITDSADVLTNEDDSIAARDTASHLEQAQNLLRS